MLQRLIPISISIICVPLCILLFCLWLAYAGSFLITGKVENPLSELYVALFVSPNSGLAIFITRNLIGTFGGLVGWLSLFALTGLTVLSTRTWKNIPVLIKVGCLIGVVSALAIPFASTFLAAPPLLLCASLVWLAVLRDEPNPSFNGTPDGAR